MALKRIFRGTQTFFPFVRPAKFMVRNFATRRLGRPLDVEFKLLRRLERVDLALDIGANWGQSIAALKNTARPRQIVSFEPNRELADWLRRIHAGDATTRIENCALSDEEGSFDLYVPRYRDYVFDGLASLDRDEAATWLRPDRMAWFDPAKVSIERQLVKSRTLDSFGFSPDVVKIDVQGAEYRVVKGGLETFRRSTPVSIVEAPDDALVELFASIGMAAWKFDGERLTPDWRGSKNTVFLSDGRRRSLGL